MDKKATLSLQRTLIFTFNRFFFYFLFPHKIAQEVEDLNDEDFGTASDKFDRENDEEPENEDEAFEELRDEENERDTKELEEINDEDEETGKS